MNAPAKIPAVATTPSRLRAVPSARVPGATSTSAEVAGGRGQACIEVTTSELADLIRPFAGAKMNPPRDAKGYALPRRTRLDIRHASYRGDADVRSVSDEGVEDCFYRGCELIPWSAIRSITILALDENRDPVSERTFVHIGETRRIAA